jgi:hypothetical protein
MKRYDVSVWPTPTGTNWEMTQVDGGAWVTHSDALAAIEAARQEEREACAKLCIAHDDFGTRPSQLANLILDRST